jgi:membrane-bound serine protease (ClpP class)
MLLPSAPAVEGPAPVVAYIPIDGPIDHGRSGFFKRALADAKAKGASVAVVHLNTDGGLLDAGREIMGAALAEDKLRLVAFIDNRAYSAGSLIAFGHHEILVTSQATLGDIGVIQQKADGSIEYAPEKIETVVRALLRSTADNRGWDTAKLMKMVARNQELWRYDLGQGPRWVIEDDLPRLLSEHADLERKEDLLLKGGTRVGHLELPKDRLLSYTGPKAVEDGMATALVADLDAVYTRLGTTRAQVIDISPTTTESVSWTLAGFAPLLAGLAVLLLVLEFKFPMGGLFLALAAVAGLAFFVCQFYMELAGSIEVVLVLVGLGLIILDIFAIPSGGMIAIGGGLLMIVGLVLAFMPDVSQFNPQTPEWGYNLGSAVFSSLLAIVALTTGVAMALMALPRLALRSGVATTAAIDATSAGADEVDPARLISRQGTARTDLAPAGQVVLDGREFSAQAEHGAFIARDTTVTVIALRYGVVVVRPVEVT